MLVTRSLEIETSIPVLLTAERAGASVMTLNGKSRLGTLRVGIPTTPLYDTSRLVRLHKWRILTCIRSGRPYQRCVSPPCGLSGTVAGQLA